MTTKFSKRIRVQPPPHICRAPPLPPGIIPPWPPNQLVASWGLKFQAPGKPYFAVHGSAALAFLPAEETYRGTIESAGQRADLLAAIVNAGKTLNVAITGLRDGTYATISYARPTTLVPADRADTRDLFWGYETFPGGTNARIWIPGKKPLPTG